MRKTILLLFVFMFIQSCQMNGLFDAGDLMTKTVNLPQQYDRIETTSIFDVSLINDSVNKLDIQCGENLINFVNIETKDGIVHINHSVKNNWSRKYDKIKLIIHCNQNFILYAYEPLHLTTINTFKTNFFLFVDWGKFCEVNATVNTDYCGIFMGADSFGGYTIKGKTNSSEIWSGGSSIVKADSLITDDCYVRQRGWGDVFVHVNQHLKVNFESTGNIYYAGHPNAIEHNQPMQSGKIIPIENQ